MPKHQITPVMKRCLGLRETITITTGTVIGVGLFTVGANVVGRMGSTVILATLAALLISIYPALLYAEMSAALPYAGGTYQYASLGLSQTFGLLSGWNFIISMVAVASGEAMAFAFYFRTLIEACGFTLKISDRMLACLSLMIFLFLAVRGVEWTGRLQNGFLFFFWGIAIVWILSILPALQFEAFTVPDPSSLMPAGFFSCTAMIWWCFAGFETCCAMGEEIRYPQINLPRALFLAPFLVFAVNGLFQWALVCIVPPDALGALASAAAPYADAMIKAGILGLPLILLCLGIAFGGDFSTLNASVSAPARYLFTMARDGALPAFLKMLHPRLRTPVPAVLILGALMLLLICTDSIAYIASLSLFATLLYYIFGMAAACGLRRKHPELKRPYRTPGLWIGAPISIVIYLFMMTQLTWSAVLAGIAWNILGLIIFFLCRRKYGTDETERANLPPLPDAPSPEEKRHMDREYYIWLIAVGVAVLIVVILHLFLLFG